ncbi:MAG: DUF2283 domain-containing protein [Candidatus Omnitrophica bacterium]|nr:DUF2283 domain-containing protein [Candidatus Omnitrophota bacterium]
MKPSKFAEHPTVKLVTYDPVAHAAYFLFEDRPVAETKKFNAYISLDLDEAGRLIGIEVLHLNGSKLHEVEEALQEVARMFRRPEVTHIHLDALQEAFQ